MEGPVKVRVLTLESEIGVPEIINADNGENGTGAVYDFSNVIPKGGLLSMKLSAPKTLTFRMSDLYPLGQGRDFRYSLLNLDVRVLGNIRKDKTGPRQEAGEQDPVKK